MQVVNGELRYSGDHYTLTVPPDRPFVYLDDLAGNRLAELFVLSGVHASGGRDDATEVGSWQCDQSGGETTFTLEARSSTWERKTYRFCCQPERLRYELSVQGTGTLDEVSYFGGYCSAFPRWGSGLFLSGGRFTEAFNPEPNAEDMITFSAASGATIDLTGGPLPGKRHWFFTPPPFCYAFRTPAGWLALGLEAGTGAYRFSEFRYHGGDAFSLTVPYEGYTRVDGRYHLPAIGFDFADDPYAALGLHVAALRAAHLVPAVSAEKPDWWRRPMFCGWGAQCGRASLEHGYVVADPANIDHNAFLATMRYAPDYARQDVYEGFLSALAGRGIHPPTVTIDDKWQKTYGENEVDETKWPNLPGFIERRHAEGQHVLLWLKAWDREGVPDAECVTNAAGLPLGVDPTNPDLERRLRASVRRMLTAYGADGFKIDFTHRIPVGPGLRMHGDAPGLELMRRYLEIIHGEAKRVKADALIMTHTPHPYLADVLDMIRLNDMLDLTRLDDPHAGRDIATTLLHRAQVARVACPDALIDTDNWPVRDRSVWRDYLRLQARIGVPSLYFATHVDLTQEPLEADDYRLIEETWNGIDTGNRRDIPVA